MDVSKRKALRYSRESKAFTSTARGEGGRRQRREESGGEKERLNTNGEEKIQTPESLVFNTVDFFFFLTWEDKKKFNLGKPRGSGE